MSAIRSETVAAVNVEGTERSSSRCRAGRKRYPRAPVAGSRLDHRERASTRDVRSTHMVGISCQEWSAATMRAVSSRRKPIAGALSVLLGGRDSAAATRGQRTCASRAGSRSALGVATAAPLNPRRRRLGDSCQFGGAVVVHHPMRVSGNADATGPEFSWDRKCASINAPDTSTGVLRSEPPRGPPAPGATRSPVRPAGSRVEGREALVEDDQPGPLEHASRQVQPGSAHRD